MERLEVDLELHDLVSGPAAKAAAALQKVELQAIKIQLANNKAAEQNASANKKVEAATKKSEMAAQKAASAFNFSKEIKKTEDALAKLKSDPGGFRHMLEVQKKLAEHRKALGKEGFLEAFKGNFSFLKLAGAAALGDLAAEGIKGAFEFGVDLLKEGIKATFEAASKKETLDLSYRLNLGEKGAKEAMEDIERFKNKTPLSGSAIAGLMVPLQMAGFDTKQARDAFAAASDISVARNEGTGGISGIIDIFERIKNKGGVSEKMLQGLHVNAKDFFGSLSQQLGISPEEAKKQAKGGGIQSERLLQTIYAMTAKREGGPLGSGLQAFGKTFEGRLAKLKTLPEEFLEKIAKSNAWKTLENKLGFLFESLSPESPRGVKIQAAIESMFGRFGNFIDSSLNETNINRFLDAVSKIPGILSAILTISETIAIVWAGSKIAGGVSSIASTSSSLLAASGAVSQSAGYLAAAGGVLASALGGYAIGTALDKVFGISDKLSGTGDNRIKDADNAEFAKGDAHRRQLHEESVARERARKLFSNTNNFKIEYHAAPGEDPTHSHQKLAEMVAKHATRALEKAHQEGGGA